MTTAVFLNNDQKMPLLGLGVYKATEDNEAENAVISAVQNGFRLQKRRRRRQRNRQMRRFQKRTFHHHKGLEYRPASG